MDDEVPAGFGSDLVDAVKEGKGIGARTSLVRRLSSLDDQQQEGMINENEHDVARSVILAEYNATSLIPAGYTHTPLCSAVILGDADQARDELTRAPGGAKAALETPDPQGFTPLAFSRTKGRAGGPRVPARGHGRRPAATRCGDQ